MAYRKVCKLWYDLHIVQNGKKCSETKEKILEKAENLLVNRHVLCSLRNHFYSLFSPCSLSTHLVSLDICKSNDKEFEQWIFLNAVQVPATLWMYCRTVYSRCCTLLTVHWDRRAVHTSLPRRVLVSNAVWCSGIQCLAPLCSLIWSSGTRT